MDAENSTDQPRRKQSLLDSSRKRRRRRRRRRQLAVLMSVVAAVVVLVERFVTEYTPLLLPCQNTALSASVRAATLAISKLQLMLAVADHLSIALPVSAPLAAGPPSPHNWFTQFLSSADAHQWRHTFRMGKPAFLNLVSSLEPELTGEILAPPDVKLASTLYRLATAASPSAVARKFALSGGAPGFVSIFEEVCRALQSKLSYLFDFPSVPELLHPITRQFSQQGFPNCCGVVGCTRFQVMPNASNGEYFESAAGYQAVAMQGVVDTAGRLLDISVGWGGSMQAAQILLQTRLFARVMDSHELLHGRPVQLLTGAPMPEYIIGDCSYPLLPWLLTPYTNPITPPQLRYNRVHEQVRSIASRVFGTLKASWRLLASGELTAGDGCIIAAACILHNYLIYSGEALVEREGEEEAVVREVCSLPPCDNSYGDSIRDALAAHLNIAASHTHSHMLPSP
ncbi:hypothetical protein GOP47_0022204 [Adiantum capillus-veneris]|uniref:DDE Tnp4 domain-containing protein n=1 Tax=Adiantum capillus-veneris TaxID=13818 RepID=A0A9D4U9S3_ADICA|nr:hypothetical protein GOP47_0022204 [Adiantum capillus-veneris]